VVNYIDKQMVGSLMCHQENYRNGLAAVVTSCKKLYKIQFGELLWDEQTDFLKKMESGKLSGLLKDDKTESGQREPGLWADGLAWAFFGLVRDHTMQGFYRWKIYCNKFNSQQPEWELYILSGVNLHGKMFYYTI
jgi:hypothetical protein